MVIIMECWFQIPWYFNLIKSRYCSTLPWYFYNTSQKYHGILTLEKGGTMVNYHRIFITLAPGGSMGLRYVLRFLFSQKLQ